MAVNITSIRRQHPLFILSMGAVLGAACSSGNPELYSVPTTEERTPCLDSNPLRNAYFGDLHVHTGFSFDAFANDVRLTPEDAYAFAQGAQLMLPPLDVSGSGTTPVQLGRPLDFAAVTDHGELFGEVQVCTVPGAAGYDSSECVQYRQANGNSIFIFGLSISDETPNRFGLCGDDNADCAERAVSVWSRIQEAAESAYDRSEACSFTSFVAYEYSGAPGISNLHRNIIFRNSNVLDAPVSFYEQPNALGLWRELDSQCTQAGTGCEVLAIPHNSNLSNGKMFVVEYPGARSERDERDQAALRAMSEPLVEIYQHKGAAECLNGLSANLGSPDESCEFEVVTPVELLGDCGEITGSGGLGGFGCVSPKGFVKEALAMGLQEEDRLGVNPYKLGLIAATDTHNATPGAVSEQSWVGHTGKSDVLAANRLDGPTLPPGAATYSPGGLAGVWAQENSRDAIFEAMRRRETWATSGPRMTVRFFGGWKFSEDACADPDLVETGYHQGVPMGRDLRGKGDVPRFVLWANQDPGTAAEPGTPLQRLEVVKVSLDADGTPRTQVFEAAATPERSLDTSTCAPSGSTEAQSLCAVWTDPDFERNQRALYYARVLEQPSCRWSTHLCNGLPAANRPMACDDPELAEIIQERAWTSPIWYSP